MSDVQNNVCEQCWRNYFNCQCGKKSTPKEEKSVRQFNSPYKIWKYSIAITDRQTLYIPGFVRFLPTVHFSPVDTEIWIWAIVDPTRASRDAKVIRVFGTGNLMMVDPSKIQYIATAQTGTFFWHIFHDI